MDGLLKVIDMLGLTIAQLQDRVATLEAESAALARATAPDRSRS